MSGERQYELALPPRPTDSVLRERIARLEAELAEEDHDGRAVEISNEIDRIRSLLGPERRR